jgi:hypothetical protein
MRHTRAQKLIKRRDIISSSLAELGALMRKLRFRM